MTAREQRPERGWLATIMVAGAVGIAGPLVLGGLAFRVLSGGVGQLSWDAWLAAGLGGLLVLAVEGLAVLTVVGGAIALRRHGLEARGLPYHSRERREWRPGLFVRATLEGIRFVRAPLSGTPRRRPLLPYDLVEVRSLAEIRETLDGRGTLDALPFMPEMAAFCGETRRVFRRVEKINDYVTGTGLRRLRDTVLLEGLRCDGQLHGECQDSCHLLWKEAWLRQTSGRRRPLPEPDGLRRQGEPDAALGGAELKRHVTRVNGDGDVRYVCQMTEVARASTHLSWNDPRHYLRDLVLGNVSVGPFVVGVSIDLFNRVQKRFGNGAMYPQLATTGLSTSPDQLLGLQAGDVVRVRGKHEIERTLTASYRNRGLWFDAEMLRFCGGEYRVSARVERLIEEKSGRLVNLGSPGIILDGVTAGGEYRVFCPQNESILWREIWLERVPPTQPGDSRPALR